MHIWLVCACDMTHSYLWHYSFICRFDSCARVTRFIYMFNTTHSRADMARVWVWHDSFICVTPLIHMQISLVCACDTTHSNLWHTHSRAAMSAWWVMSVSWVMSAWWVMSVSWVMSAWWVMSVSWLMAYETWLVRHNSWDKHDVWLMAHLTAHHVEHDSFICNVTDAYATWLIHTWHYRATQRIHAWPDAFTCVTWPIHMCDTTHPNAWHIAFTRVTWLTESQKPRGLHIRDTTHSCAWHNSFISVTWLTQSRRPRGRNCLKRHIQHSYVWHNLFIRVTWLTQAQRPRGRKFVIRCIHHSCVWHNSFRIVARRICLCGMCGRTHTVTTTTREDVWDMKSSAFYTCYTTRWT